MTREPVSEFARAELTLPEAGRCEIAPNWVQKPALVIQSLEITVRRFCDVDLAFAEAETASLAAWRRDHQAYFTRTIGFTPDMELICEHFCLVEDLTT